MQLYSVAFVQEIPIPKIMATQCDLTKGVGTELKCADPDISYTTNEVSQGYKFYF